MDFLKSFSIDPVNMIMFMPPEPPSYNDNYKNLYFIPSNDKKLENIPFSIYKPNDINNTTPYFVIYCHGNAMDLGQCNFLSEIANQIGITLLAFDYTGYGLATKTNTKPSEKTAIRDVRRVYDFVRNELKYPAERIILYGQSIGSGIATECVKYAQNNGDNIMALFLQSAYTSIRDVAVDFVGFAGNLIINRFNTRNTLKILKCPILFTHGNVDEVIPYTMSEILKNEYTGHEIVYFHTADNCGHNDMDTCDDLVLPFGTIIAQIESTRNDIIENQPEFFNIDKFKTSL